MSMSDAIHQVERSFTTAQTSIETLKRSAKDPNDRVFQKSLQDLVATLKQGSEALTKIETMHKTSKGVLEPTLVTKIQKMMSAMNALDRDIQAKVGALQNSVLWAELQTHLANINNKTSKLSLRRGERVANVEQLDTQG